MNYYSFVGAPGQGLVLLSGTSRIGEPDDRCSFVGAPGQGPVLRSGTFTLFRGPKFTSGTFAPENFGPGGHSVGVL
jgi:hypothetical protein